MALPDPLLVPAARVAIAGNAPCSMEWREFFRRLVEYMATAGVDPSVLSEIIARLDELEQNENNFSILGLMSVTVIGTPSGGLVQVSLESDVQNPGNTYYYGTGPTGTKGWFAIADAFTPGDGITLTTGSDGVTEIAHGDTSSVTDITASFSGSTVVEEISLTFDQFGHVVSRTITGRQLDHNDLNAIQGGAPGEYYHLTAAQHAAVSQALPFATAMHIASMRP